MELAKIKACICEGAAEAAIIVKSSITMDRVRDVIVKVEPLFTADQKAKGILASVSLAQFILESGYGKSELAQNVNNCFGMKLRYDGLKGCTDYKKVVQIIKDDGYATSPTYVENLCSIIEEWKLTQYDATSGSTLWSERGLLLLPDGNLSSLVPPSTALCVSAHPYHQLPICIYSNKAADRLNST